jgi:hypothetical protein
LMNSVNRASASHACVVPTNKAGKSVCFKSSNSAARNMAGIITPPPSRGTDTPAGPFLPGSHPLRQPCARTPWPSRAHDLSVPARPPAVASVGRARDPALR